MKHGFIKTACVTPNLKVADCEFNSDQIIYNIKKADSLGITVCVFPELSITGYTCGDLFFQKKLLDNAMINLKKVIAETSYCNMINIVGLPISCNGKIYNAAAVFQRGSLLALIPKKNIPNYSEFYEARYFTPGIKYGNYNFFGSDIPFGTDYVFQCSEMNEFTFGIEICEDLWVSDTPSVQLAKNGANMIINLSASNEVIGKSEYRRTLIKAKSGSLLCAYLYANAGIGESTTDMVYSGHSIIAENGTITSESEKFTNGIISYDVDLQKIDSERRRLNTFTLYGDSETQKFKKINFSIIQHDTNITNKISPTPFIPSKSDDLDKRCKEISMMQAFGLVKRLKHTGSKTAVIGLSGGLDSTLALIVTVNAFKKIDLDTKGIITVTMPCFGTTDRTYHNACLLAEKYGTTLREINIKESVEKHFNDINHDINIHDITFENSQARERTQVLMDIANQSGGLVIGTGDLSELALGWATYNGDHMSMYAVNASIPKTLVRYLVKYESCCQQGTLRQTLEDILNTPVSPELLPPDEHGDILQKTEDLVGPYELHDFYLYYMIRFGFSPDKILRMAIIAFEGIYDKNTILKWEKIFYKRFFSQQFKRSCLPDGPKVGSVTLSPRSDFRMPSDASVNIWLEDI